MITLEIRSHLRFLILFSHLFHTLLSLTSLPLSLSTNKVMSSTKESQSNNETRVSSLNVRPSVAGIIADSDGNLDEKKAVAALSQTRIDNKHLWIGGFVLIGVVFVLIAANIGTSVAVARLTRQLNVDPVTGMATIAGSDDVVMKTSMVVYKEEDVSFHTVPINYLSVVKTVEFADGDLSFDVKGFARMSKETILLVEGGSLIFDIYGLKNVTGDELMRLFPFSDGDMESSDLDGRKLPVDKDGNYYSNRRIPPGCINRSTTPHECNGPHATAPIPGSPCYPLTGDNRCGAHRRGPGYIHYACPSHFPYCNEANFWCGSTEAHRDAQDSHQHDYAPHCSF